MKNLSRVGAVVAGTALVAVAATSGATAAKWIDGSDIKKGTVASKQIKNNSIASRDIAQGAVQIGDLSPFVQKKVRSSGAAGAKGDQGEQGEQGDPATDVFGESVVDSPFEGTVEKVGGSFTANATTLGEITLDPGTYLLTADAFFITKQATSGATRMQVAVRGQDGSEWGSDLGTGFTGNMSATAKREETVSTVRTVVIEETTTVEVKVFGYADDQGSADSGKIDATVRVSAIRVG